MITATPRTIAVRCRRNGRRLSRLRIEYPQWATDPAGRPAYDVPMARQLLALTAELPASKRGLLAVLAEYRHALHAMTQLAETCEQRRDFTATPPAAPRAEGAQWRAS